MLPKRPLTRNVTKIIFEHRNLLKMIKTVKQKTSCVYTTFKATQYPAAQPYFLGSDFPVSVPSLFLATA